MSVAYITEQGAVITKDGNNIVVKKEKKTIRTIHSFDIEQIFVFGNITLTPGIIGFVLKRGIDTVFLSSRGEYRGRLISYPGKNIELRRLQFEKMNDTDLGINLARAYINGKIRNCRTILRRFNRERSEQRIIEGLHQLFGFSEVLNRKNSIDEIRGIEGISANIYFDCFKYLISNPSFTATPL